MKELLQGIKEIKKAHVHLRFLTGLIPDLKHHDAVRFVTMKLIDYIGTTPLIEERVLRELKYPRLQALIAETQDLQDAFLTALPVVLRDVNLENVMRLHRIFRPYVDHVTVATDSYINECLERQGLMPEFKDSDEERLDPNAFVQTNIANAG